MSFRKPSLGFNVALPLRAKKPKRGSPLASRKATPSSPMTSFAPSASLPMTSAPAGLLRDRLMPTLKLPLTLTAPGGSTGSNTLTPASAAKSTAKEWPSCGTLRLRFNASAALMALDAPMSNSSVAPRPAGAGNVHVGLPIKTGNTWGTPQPLADADGAVNERSIALPITRLMIASVVCTFSTSCGVVAPIRAASLAASRPAAGLALASPLSISSIFAMLKALGRWLLGCGCVSRSIWRMTGPISPSAAAGLPPGCSAATASFKISSATNDSPMT